MPRGSDVYKNPWLKAEDLQDDEDTFTITGSDLHTFQDQQTGKEKAQIVLSFRETDKKFGLNVTNFGVLKDIFGSDDSDDWHGHKVVLFVTQTSMTDGRAVDCLRVKRKATEKLRDQKRASTSKPARSQQPQPITQAEVDADDEDLPF